MSTGPATSRLLIGFDGTSLPTEVARLAHDAVIAGVVLFARNIESTPQWAALVEEIVGAFPPGLPPIIAVDQEGGAVQRLKPPAIPEATRVPPMGELAEWLDERDFEGLGRAMGGELAALGVNVDFAPVLDVDTNPDNPVIGKRAFGRTPEAVIARGLAFARGLERAGIAWCAKHFPGHGDTRLDSHFALPSLPHDLARLEAVELVPFAAAVRAEAPMIMSAHVVFSALDREHPATLSPRVIPDLLRRRLGYNGVVVSDDLDMLAIRDHYDAAGVARGLAAADVDLALVCRDLDFARAVAAALPESPRALARVTALRRRLAPPRIGVVPPFPQGLV